MAFQKRLKATLMTKVKTMAIKMVTTKIKMIKKKEAQRPKERTKNLQ